MNKQTNNKQPKQQHKRKTYDILPAQHESVQHNLGFGNPVEILHMYTLGFVHSTFYVTEKNFLQEPVKK